MKPNRPRLSARYLTGLRTFLVGRPGASRSRIARALGKSAVASGLAPVELAEIHGCALHTLAAEHQPPRVFRASLFRAGVFFAEFLGPFESQYRITQIGVNRLCREVTRRHAGETALRTSRGQYRRLLVEARTMQRKLRRLMRQVITAQEEERKVISRELHDEVVQLLIGISVDLASLGPSAKAMPRSVQVRIARSQELVASAVKTVHRFARELRPPALDDLGLVAALRFFCRELGERTGLRLRFNALSEVDALGASERTVLYRVAQEALTNVVRHAQATEASLVITAPLARCGSSSGTTVGPPGPATRARRGTPPGSALSACASASRLWADH